MTEIILVDKPRGLTSRDVCDRIKAIFNSKKTGHSGTLDANATGLLLIALDNAVKAMPLFEGLDKEYEGIMYLHKDVDVKQLKKTISEFIGEIVQVPPAKSRVARKPRKRRIYYFDTISIEGKNVKFRTRVQAGTYIRKLVDDIGKKIGGAHLKELRRTKIGNFSIDDAHTIEEIEKSKNYLIPIEDALGHVKKVFIKNYYLPRLLNGSPIFSNYIEKKDNAIKANEKVAIICNSKLIAIGVARVDLDKTNKGVLVKTDRIIFT